MFTSLHISGFRSFREVRVDPLTRVNLFVGTNNAGKTSILDAAELVGVGMVAGLLRSPRRREERIIVDPEEGSIPEPEWDLSHLFFGHGLRIGNSFRVVTGSQARVQCDVLEGQGTEHQQLLPLGSSEPTLALRFKSHVEEVILPISPYGGVPNLVVRRSMLNPTLEAGPRVNFLGTEDTTAFQLSQLWDAIVLTPEEAGVVSALQIVEPSIERIAFAGETRGSRRRILLKLADSDRRLPLGTAGDGLKRLLALSLRLFSARGGYLLIDEIDTGLHFTVMANMWRLVIETAKRLDIQVLATTHSLDCVRALAWIREQHPESALAVTLHRVERDRSQTVSYTMDELAVAARNYLEVR